MGSGYQPLTGTAWHNHHHLNGLYTPPGYQKAVFPFDSAIAAPIIKRLTLLKQSTPWSSAVRDSSSLGSTLRTGWSFRLRME